MKAAKCKYFDNKIASIADHNKRPWDFMSWTRTWKLDSSEAIIFKGEPCLTTEDHWNAFQATFNSAHKQDTYPTHLMQAIHHKPKWAWVPFSACELCEALISCSGQSVPGPDHGHTSNTFALMTTSWNFSSGSLIHALAPVSGLTVSKPLRPWLSLN